MVKGDWDSLPFEVHPDDKVVIQSFSKNAKEKGPPQDEGMRSFLITFNPPDDLYLPDSVKAMGPWGLHDLFCEKVMSYKMCPGDGIVVYEQRSDDVDNPRGYHCHILIANRSGQSLATVLNMSKRALLQLRDPRTKVKFSPVGHESVDVKMISWQAGYKYLSGDKESEEKRIKCAVDKQLRSLYGYPDIIQLVKNQEKLL